MKKTTRKLLATLLTFAMLFGSSLTVFAEEIEWKDLSIGQELHDEDQIIVTNATLQQNGTCEVILNVNNGEVASGRYPDTAKFYYRISIPENKVWKVDSKNEIINSYNSPDPVYTYSVEGHEIDVVPSSNPTPSSNPVEEPSKIEEVHEHSYSWETVQEATTEQDGIEEYRCSCGDVKERNVIPASQALVSGLFDIVKNASLNGVAQYDSGRLYTMSDYIIKKLAERSDVTTVVTFEYERKPYKMTIPAGVDYSAILADDDYFYGYFYFAKITGSTIEEVN